MRISRHFIDVGERRVHYRMAGAGPALLQADPAGLRAAAPAVSAWRLADWARGHCEMWQPI